MGGISTGTGIFSGINTQELIGQLMALESRPKILIQQRIAQLQTQQAAYLDINSRLGSLRDAAAAFRTGKTFQSKKAVSSDEDILKATAAAGATPGTYQMIVDRLVSSQQMLSRGFASSSAALNAGDFVFESAAARLDRDTALADLNGGEGVARGKIILAVQGGGAAETIDLSRVGTVSEVIDAINSNGLGITAKVSGNHLVLSHASANITVTSASGYETAASLGIERLSFTSATVTGADLYRMGAETALKSLNDGNGVYVGNVAGSAAFDFTVRVTDGATVTDVNVNLGSLYDAQSVLLEGPVSTVGGVIERINDAMTAAGLTDVTASIAADGSGMRIVDGAGTKTLRVIDNSTTVGDTARDLGFVTDTDFTGTAAGERILAGMNSTLARSLNGGSGIAGDGTISITDRTGTVHAVAIDTTASLADILAEFSADTGGAITAALDSRGTGLVLTDTTAGTGNLIVAGETAESLGIDTTGVAASTIAGGNLQHQYMTVATRLDSLRNGAGIGTGSFVITDSTGASQTVEVKDTDETLGDIIRLINSRGTRIKARLNDQGDGLELYEDSGGGTQKIKVEDRSGGVAAALNIEGEAAGPGVQNVINGSFEKVIDIAATDSLTKVVEKINSAGLGVAATIINDGAGSTPFRLSLTATVSGTAGRFLFDTGTLDMDLTTLDAGQDSRVFFGATDPARGVLLASSTNTLDSVISGVTIDLNGVSEDPVTLSVSRDTASIESAVSAFVDAFNGVTDRITQQTRYDAESKQRGPLLGDGTAISLRSALFSTIQGRAQGLSGQFDALADVGVTVGAGGKLQLDRDRLRQAIEQDPQAVEDVFAARVLTQDWNKITLPGGATATDPNAVERFDKLGVAGQIEQLVKTYVDTVDGILTGRSKALTDQIASQNGRIDALNVRLESRRAILERQFLAMEEAIGKLQSQQGALGSIGLR